MKKIQSTYYVAKSTKLYFHNQLKTGKKKKMHKLNLSSKTKTLIRGNQESKGEWAIKKEDATH